MFSTPNAEWLMAQNRDPAPVVGLFVVLFLFTLSMLIALVTILLKRYKRCPPNRLLVIYGKIGSGEAAHVMHGGTRLIIPLIQDYAWLNLEPIRVTVPPLGESFRKKLGFQPPGNYTVAIGTGPELAQNAAIRLLGLDNAAIESLVIDLITDELTGVADTACAEDASPDEEAFYVSLRSALESKLQALGLELVHFKREPH